MAWPDFMLQFGGKLKEDFERFNTYFATIKGLWNGHVGGTSDKHPAENITYSGMATGTDVKSAIDNLKTDFVNLSFTGSEHDALVTTALVDSENEDFGPEGNATYLNGRLTKWEERFTAQLSDNAKKSTDWLNIKELGADNTGSISCSDILDFALSQGKNIYIPTGIFAIDRPFILNRTISIIGDGYSSKLKWIGEGSDAHMVIVGGEETNNKVKYVSILNIAIDGNLQVNGVYDGFYSSLKSTRLIFADTRVMRCKTAITAKAVGSEFRNLYLYGDLTEENNPNPLCNTGLKVLGTDNVFTDMRIQCFCNFGFSCENSSNVFNNVKSAVNGQGAYLQGNNLRGSIEVQENYNDGIVFNGVANSNFELMVGGSGCVLKAEYTTIPDLTELNVCVGLKILNCYGLVITGGLKYRQTFSDRYSCETTVMLIDDVSHHNKLSFMASSLSDSLTYPDLLVCNNLLTNAVEINGIKFTPDNNFYREYAKIANPTSLFSTASGMTFNTTTDDSLAYTFTGDTPVGLFYVDCTDYDYVNMRFMLNKKYNTLECRYRYVIDGTTRYISNGIIARIIRVGKNAMISIFIDMSKVKSDSTYTSLIGSGGVVTSESVFFSLNSTAGVTSDNKNNLMKNIAIYSV